MSHTTIHTPDGGETLRELHRRLVSIHHGLATAGPDDEDRDVYALEGLDDALRFITEQPAYRTAREDALRATAATGRQSSRAVDRPAAPRSRAERT